MQPDIRYIDLGGRTRVASYGGSGNPVILVHGLGGSHANWNAIGGQLNRYGSVAALDLAGFGMSAPEGRSTTVQANAQLVVRFADFLAPGDPVTLVGNSMGGLISIIAASENPQLVSRLILIDPAVPVDPRGYEAAVAANLVIPSLPLVGPRYLAKVWRETPPADLVKRSQELVYADPGRVDPAQTAESIAFAEQRATLPWAPAAFSQAARSIGFTNSSPARFSRMIAKILARTLVIHGDQDRLVPLPSARWLVDHRPDWTLEILEGVGHVPMLESPKDTLELIAEWWATLPDEPAL